MRASSDSIAHLAASLAKAQLELVNPPKTLTACLDDGRHGGPAQSYRYAPLSAGLDIVRKTLCKHELAVIQTTHVDRDSAMVLLTTTLAHGSGEWISAHWPVCRSSDIAHPKVMGAALTYARRYGLFTLVGLAGEDDLDGPELAPVERGESARAGGRSRGAVAVAVAMEAVEPPPMPPPERCFDEGPPVAASGAGDCTAAGETEARAAIAPATDRPWPRRRNGRTRPPRQRIRSILSRDPLRDLSRVDSDDALLRWALAILPLRNRLADGARASLDEAFLARADALGTDPELLLAFRADPGFMHAEKLGPAAPTGGNVHAAQ